MPRQQSSVLAAVLIWLLTIGMHVESKQFMRCELTNTLLDAYKFDRTYLPHWICLVEHESDRNTRKVTTLANHSKNYGLFQINSKSGCQVGRAGGLCNKKCEDFSDDDISDDVECAQLIQHREGFKYWKGWVRYCKSSLSNNLPNLKVACNLDIPTPSRTSRIIQRMFSSSKT